MASSEAEKPVVKKPDLDHMAWAIEQRAEVQRTILALYEYVRGGLGLRKRNEIQLLDLLIGAAFSLWRAVFLADKFRDTASVHQDQEKFLEKLITDNAITFVDDKNHRSWTVAYYLENAKYRLIRAVDVNIIGKNQKADRDLLLGHLRISGSYVELTRYEWESAHFVLRRMLKHLNPGAKVEAKLPTAPEPPGLEKFFKGET